MRGQPDVTFLFRGFFHRCRIAPVTAMRLNTTSAEHIMDSIGYANVSRLFLGTLIIHVATIVPVIAAVSMRPTLPAWMLSWFEHIAYPQLACSFLMLFRYKRLPC